MASKPRLMLDLDGVVYDWDMAARRVLREEFDDVGALPPQQYWNQIQEMVTDDHWKWLWREGRGGMFGQDDCYYPGAPSFMRWAGVNTELVVVTNRPRDAAIQTFEFLARHRVQAAEVRILGTGVPKSSVVPGFDAAIDDKPKVCDDMLLKTCAEVFCPRRTWNADYDPPTREAGRLHRYDDLKEVQEWLTTRR